MPALVDEQTFELAQERLQDNQKFSLRRTVEPSILQGLVHCAQCGYGDTRAAPIPQLLAFTSRATFRSSIFCMATKLQKTVTHEAGHAVAHARLAIEQSIVSIVSGERFAGHVTAEGVDHVWSKHKAGPMVKAFCAGYAAMIAAGHSERVSLEGCEGDGGADFAQARYLIEHWSLAGDLEAWKARTVKMMRQRKNLAAVQLVADHLKTHRRLDGDYVQVVIGVADGETTTQEFEQYLHFRRSVEGQATPP